MDEWFYSGVLLSAVNVFAVVKNMEIYVCMGTRGSVMTIRWQRLYDCKILLNCMKYFSINK